jgi:hypothetical protein
MLKVLRCLGDFIGIEKEKLRFFPEAAFKSVVYATTEVPSRFAMDVVFLGGRLTFGGSTRNHKHEDLSQR